MGLQRLRWILGNHKSVPGWAYWIIPFIEGSQSSEWFISRCNVVTWSRLASEKRLAQSYSGQNGSIKQSDKITWLTTQHPETVWTSRHLSENIQVCFEDIQVTWSSTALGNRFWRLTALSRKWIFLLFSINIYRNYISAYIHKIYSKHNLFIYLSVQPLEIVLNFYISSSPLPTDWTRQILFLFSLGFCIEVSDLITDVNDKSLMHQTDFDIFFFLVSYICQFLLKWNLRAVLCYCTE